MAAATAALAEHTRVIFLDVDGVLNNQTSRRMGQAHDLCFDCSFCFLASLVCPIAVARLPHKLP